MSDVITEEALETLKRSGNDVFETSGIIKWFDSSKGYGFITPDDGSKDILLHVTCLRYAGYQTAPEGASIHCYAMNLRNGYQAIHIISMDTSTAVEPECEYPVVTPESNWNRAVCKWFNRVRGFGFLNITDEKTPDIFCHVATLRRSGFTELRPGQIVLVRYGRGANGLAAAELRPIESEGK